MAAQGWTVKQLIEALKKFPSDAKVFYELGQTEQQQLGKHVKARGEDNELGVLLDR